MTAQLTAVMAVLGTGAPQAEKKEWMMAAMIHLESYPGKLCAEALHVAAKQCEGLRSVIKFVEEYCESYPARMEARLEKLYRLQEIANR